MPRLTATTAALLLFSTTAAAQGREAAPATASPSQRVEVILERPAARPLQMLPQAGFEAAADFGADSDTLSEEQILRRIGRVYRYQSNLLLAEAEGDAEEAARLLELAMTELGPLLHQPEIMERTRFRELYRTIVTEYERYYGASDSLGIQRGEIFAFRADMFAALNEDDAPLLEDVLPRDLPPMETVFPMTMNRLVEQSIAYLLRQPDKHLYHWLSRAETYLPMIEEIFAEEGVPDELKYLAMVESGLNPTAQSWARATGMWQFIAATGRAYDLQVNPYVDERKDPEKSTRAAARHLRDLHEMFGGDWQLALSGYNCSPGRIRAAIRRAEAELGRKATFWDIYPYIPRETRNYVPMFIAAALITSNPEAFDLPEIQPGPRYEYDHAPVPGLFSLPRAAELAGTDVATLRALNPELKRSLTPPTEGAYYLRLPLGSYERFAEGYAALPQEERRPSKEYVVQRGDVLSRIAGRYGVSVSALMRTNGLRSALIRPGQRLVVPVPDYAGKGTDFAEARPERVQYGRRGRRPIAAATRPKAPRQAAAPAPEPPVAATRATTPAQPTERPSAEPKQSETRVVYRVRRGDTLSRIAGKYGVGIGELKGWNDLRGSTIQAGQILYIYPDGAPSEAPERSVYRVRPGDNLTTIARKHGVSVRDLRRWNDLRGSAIQAGQQLYIHGAAETEFYRVRRGDTLSNIAKRHGVRIGDLKRWNDLRSSTIHPGQKLRIRG